MQFHTLFLYVQLIRLFLVHCYVNTSEGDINLAVIFSNCNSTVKNDQKLDTFRWIVDRINVLNVFKSLNFGITAYNACKSEEYVESFVDIWRKDTTYHFIGAVTEEKVPGDVENLASSLRLNIKKISSDYTYLVRSTIRLLEDLGWTENVTAVLQDKRLVDKLFEFARERGICIRKYWILK